MQTTQLESPREQDAERFFSDFKVALKEYIKSTFKGEFIVSKTTRDCGRFTFKVYGRYIPDLIFARIPASRSITYTTTASNKKVVLAINQTFML